MEENLEEKISAHSLKSAHSTAPFKSKTSLSTIPEETRSHVTDAANLSTHSSTFLEEIMPTRSSTSILLEKKMAAAQKSDFMKKSKEKMLSRRASIVSPADEEKKWEEYQMKLIDKEYLFPTVLKDDSKSSKKSKVSSESLDLSFLVTGFGMRNLESLQNALNRQKRMIRLLESGQLSTPREEAASFTSESITISSVDVCTSTTDDTTSSFDKSFEKQRLEYLMGLSAIAQEEEYPEEKYEFVEEESVEEPLTGTTLAMRQAQKYLRTHKIFEFFRFLISHLLSAIPDNPIDFLIDLLDKCLLYRAGFCEAPVLYTKPHLEQLFYLMDRMRIGYIEYEQYVVGLRTLGICSYNQNPTMTVEGLVAKDTFIEEAYECLVDQMNEMVRRWKGKDFTYTAVPPPTPCSSFYPCPHPTPCTYSQFTMFPEG